LGDERPVGKSGGLRRCRGVGDVDIPEELRRRWEEFERKAKRIRRQMADWDFIRSQPRG